MARVHECLKRSIKIGDEDVQNELLASFRHQRHLRYRGAQSGYPAAIRCSLDEEIFSFNHQVHNSLLCDVSDLIPKHGGTTEG
ncbi:hypothetical protein J6590_069581 [Homalodisca vitripennis]|nr:hypothetical protein J6590_069581 [Homalodisca vitripennis]